MVIQLKNTINLKSAIPLIKAEEIQSQKLLEKHVIMQNY